ncbi:MAG: hypothetical protein J5667_06575 [Bacteroidales bacterium]|nr:hypothetical protein [Bacteroidales bacterium]
MKTSKLTMAAFAVIAAALVCSCASSKKKIEQIRNGSQTAALSLPELSEEKVNRIRQTSVEDLTVEGENGQELHIMKAIRDEQTGEMVASEQLRAAVLVARFRNVAERLGDIDLDFMIVVSDSLQDPAWQLRFEPLMFVMEDTLRLEPVLITGEDFRRAQIRGYDRYDRYLRSLSRDSSLFVDRDQAGKFLQRTAELSREEVEDHYSRRGLKWLNARKASRKESLRRRYIKVPIEPEYARLDSVCLGTHPFIYTYSHRMHTRPGLRKITVTVDGAIYDADRVICELPRSEPVTFYVSSVSTLADTTTRFLTVLIPRAIRENISCSLAFAGGSSTVDTSLADNAQKVAGLRERMAELLCDRELELDSLIVTSSCSPDGPYAGNARLAQQRADAVREYFGLDCTARGIAENWEMLDSLVEADPMLRAWERKAYRRICAEKDPDVRESKLRGQKFFPYIKCKHYPALRHVRFDYHLHRKGIEQDTLVTTVPDSTYMRGVSLLLDREYEQALSVLSAYRDFNTAVAYMALDYNATAAEILESLPSSAPVDYILALSYSRRGRETDAVEHLLKAVAAEPTYKYRGNLDPEIAAIIRKYALFEED